LALHHFLEIPLFDVRSEKRFLSFNVGDERSRILFERRERAGLQRFAKGLDQYLPGDAHQRAVLIDHDAHGIVIGQHEELVRGVVDLVVPAVGHRNGTVGRKGDRQAIHYCHFRRHSALLDP
jgi:hypothetical protein